MTDISVSLLASQTVKHLYVSTACQHGHHDYCQRETGATGQKTPAQCKFCAAPCLCPCHGAKS